MEHLHTLLLNACPDALCCLSKTGEIIFASKAFQALFGAAPNTYVPATLQAWADPSHAIRVQEALADPRALSDGIVFSFRPRDEAAGEERSFEAVLRPLSPEENTSLPHSASFLCIIRDISQQERERKTLIAQLAQAQFDQLHRDTLVEMIPGLVWHGPVDPQDPSKYRTTTISDYLERITGYTPKQYLETPNFWRSILHPDDRERILRRTEQTLQEGKPMPPYRIYAKDGRIVWFQSFVRTIRNAEGKPYHMFGLTLDVTEFKETETAMAEVLEHAQSLQTRLNEVIEGIPGIVWESWFEEDPNRDRVNFCSEQLHQFTSKVGGDWCAEPRAWLKLIHPSERTQAEAELSRIEEQGQGYLEFQIAGRDNQRVWIENHIVCMRDEGGKLEGLRGIALNITERKLADLERRRLEKEVREQDRRIDELSAPLIPLSDEIIVMPLVGRLDGKRSRNILQALLKGVSSMRARVAMLDVTGLYAVTRENADDLIRAVQAVGLLGAEVVLTGVRPELAQALVEMDVDLSRVRVRRTLAIALGEFLGKRGRS